MPVPCPRRQTSSSSSSRCPRKWFQQRCSSPSPASSCERAKPRKSSSLHHQHLQNQRTTPTLKECCHFKLRSLLFFLCISGFSFCLSDIGSDNASHSQHSISGSLPLSSPLSSPSSLSFPLCFHPVFICSFSRSWPGWDLKALEARSLQLDKHME